MSTAKPTPEGTQNRPGLPRLRARAGTHPTFLASLMRGLADANRPGLAELRARSREPRAARWPVPGPSRMLLAADASTESDGGVMEPSGQVRSGTAHGCGAGRGPQIWVRTRG